MKKWSLPSGLHVDITLFLSFLLFFFVGGGGGIGGGRIRNVQQDGLHFNRNDSWGELRVFWCRSSKYVISRLKIG